MTGINRFAVDTAPKIKFQGLVVGAAIGFSVGTHVALISRKVTFSAILQQRAPI
jgi:hypothetical protein